MISKQEVTRKKKRTCKHVLKAGREKLQYESLPSSETSPPPKEKLKKPKVKDPSEAAYYLSAWKQKDVGGDWKFNKNIQSWLLRHMYQADKVTKGTFTLLSKYMEGLQGSTRTRTVADAKRRALRYKEYEKSRDSQQESESLGDEVDDKEESKKNFITDEDDETRWKRLDDHEKRKEYKRARKVLEILKE
jgi:hypothetical protein